MVTTASRDTFRPTPPEQNVKITLEIPATHHARLVAAGAEHNLPAEEVARQFLSWAITTKMIATPAPKKTRKPKDAPQENKGE
jgi:hypothetical protein